jgi:hypothetical protein
MDSSNDPANSEEYPTQNQQAVSVKQSKQSLIKKAKIKFKKLNKNMVLAGILVAVLVLVGTTTIFLTRDRTKQSREASVSDIESISGEDLAAIITLSEGTTQLKDSNGDWNDANLKSELREEMSIRTVGAASRAVIEFADGSELRLDANSEVELTTLKTERIVIKHVDGYTYNRVIPTEELLYVVNSIDAQYEALGTAFKTAATGDEQAVEVFESSVLETSTNKTPKAGEKLIVRSIARPADNGKIKKLNIEDVKKDPFMQWNRELDIKSNRYKNSLGFLKDITAPEIRLDAKDGDVVFLDPNATIATVELTGSTEPGANLSVISRSQPGTQKVEVTVGSDGKFITPVLTALIGDSVFEFESKDLAGNTGVKTVRITFQRKSQPVAGNESSFVLSSRVGDDKIDLSWAFRGLEAPDGVKIIYGKSKNPVLTSDSVKSFGVTQAATTATIKFSDIDSKSTYYIKACIYDKASGTCGLYSTQVEVDVP